MNLKFWNRESKPTSKFQVGDMVLIRCGDFDPPSFEKYRNCDFEIVGATTENNCDWKIVAYDGVGIGAQQCCLKKLPPPEDGIAEWSDCIWQPDLIGVTEQI